MSTPPPAQARAKARRTLFAVAAVVAAPVLVSYALYYLSPPGRFANYGELLPTQPFPAIAGTGLDGERVDLAAQRGRWLLLVPARVPCDDGCAKGLYATRQARAIQGREADRVARIWLASGAAPPDASLLAQHPDVAFVRVTEDVAAALPRGSGAIYLVDPLGHQVLAWPADPDVKALAKDLARLLKASRIG